MRRDTLDAPQAVELVPPDCECFNGRAGLAEATAVTERPANGLDHQSLAGPVPASQTARLLFDPKHGWLRRLERASSRYVSRVIYPRIPGMSLPYSWLLGRHLTLSEATIGVAGLPESLSGLRVLLVTDIHAGPFVSPSVLQRTLRRLMGTQPDLILLGGDLVTARAEEITEHRQAFASLGAPLGVFAVLGNHDHYTEDPERVRELLADCGVTVLHNSFVSIGRQGERLDLAGIDDSLIGQPDLHAALDGTRPPVVLLAHNPDVLFEAAAHGVGLVLSGHTHAGQIRVPRLPVLVRQSRYRLDYGRYRLRDTELVVSRGLGATGVPLRLFCPPEAMLLTLRS